MQLLVNCRILSKSISLEESCYGRSQAIALLSSFFDVKKGPISKSAANVVLEFKFLGTSKFVFY